MRSAMELNERPRLPTSSFDRVFARAVNPPFRSDLLRSRDLMALQYSK